MQQRSRTTFCLLAAAVAVAMAASPIMAGQRAPLRAVAQPASTAQDGRVDRLIVRYRSGTALRTDKTRAAAAVRNAATRSGLAATDALAGELQQHVKSRLAPFKYPRWIEFIDELPKTATGKIQRFRLRERERARTP